MIRSLSTHGLRESPEFPRELTITMPRHRNGGDQNMGKLINWLILINE